MHMTPKLLAAGAVLGLLLAMQSASASDHKALLKANKFPEAERAAAAKLAQEPANADAMVARTLAILGTGDAARIPEAVKQAEQCVAVQAANARCHVALGKALGAKAMNGGMMSAMGYAGDIRDSFKKGVELDARNVDARVSLMQFYMMAPAIMGGGTSKAEALAAQTASVNPEAGKLMLAMLDIGAGKLAKAEAGVLAVRAGSDEDLQDHQEDQLANVAMRYVMEKKYLEGERVFRDVVKRYPNNMVAAYGIARAQQEQGKHREALLSLDQALIKTPKPHVHYRIGQSHQALGEKAKAVAAYEKALASRTGLSSKFRSDAEDQLKALKG